MLTIAYLGNGKSTNRYHLPFSRKLTNKINIKKIFSPSEPVWKTFEDIEYTDQLSDLWDDPEIQLVSLHLVNFIMNMEKWHSNMVRMY